MNHQLLFKTIVGSQAYGATTPASDTDYKGVYRQSIDELIGFGYREQWEISKDECYYEVRRFLQLLQSGNPTVLELLYMPDRCIVHKHPAFDLIIAQRHRFLTQKCRHSFGGYAVQQIQKARGLNKKMNWEKARVQRKTPLDFVYAYESGKTMPLTQWLAQRGLHQQWCGLTRLDHFRDGYALYYDEAAHEAEAGGRQPQPLGFKGVVLDDSNDIRLSDTPLGMQPLTIVSFNKDGYSVHCKEYRQYQEWLEKRNENRYVDVTDHQQQIDGKNLMHCRRLLDVALEIAREQTIRVERPNADYLLSIRRGAVSLEAIIDQAEADLLRLDQAFAHSGLPEEVDKNFLEELLLAIRRHP